MSGETMWFDRKPGDSVAIGSETHGDPTTLLIGDGIPDWVRAPEEIGGHKLRVLGSFGNECPSCKDGRPVRHLECAEGFFVAECRTHGFSWYKRRA